MHRFYLLIVGIFMFNSFICSQELNNFNSENSFSDKLGARNYNFEVESTFGTMFNDSWYLTNKFSPSMNFKLTKKFTTVVGVGVSYSTFNNIPLLNSEFQFERTDVNLTSFYAYASGIYKVKENLNIYTTVLVEEAMFDYPESSVVSRNQFKDISVGFNYKLNSKVSFNAEFQFSDRPYSNFRNNYYSPWGNYSPFGINPLY